MAFSQYSKNRHDLDTLRLGKEKKKKRLGKGINEDCTYKPRKLLVLRILEHLAWKEV